MIEEIVNFITEHPSTIETIQEEYDISQHELQNMLRDAEISGMVMRKIDQGKEFYYA